MSKGARTLLTDSELSDRWGLSTKTLRRWRKKGIGPKFIQVGKTRKRTFYLVDEIIRIEDGNSLDGKICKRK
jgi:DNA-binding transcriptional MerR regulator